MYETFILYKCRWKMIKLAELNVTRRPDVPDVVTKFELLINEQINKNSINVKWINHATLERRIWGRVCNIVSSGERQTGWPSSAIVTALGRSYRRNFKGARTLPEHLYSTTVEYTSSWKRTNVVFSFVRIVFQFRARLMKTCTPGGRHVRTARERSRVNLLMQAEREQEVDYWLQTGKKLVTADNYLEIYSLRVCLIMRQGKCY